MRQARSLRRFSAVHRWSSHASRSRRLDAAPPRVKTPATKVVQMPYHLPEFNEITKTWAEPLFQKVLLGQMSAKDFLDQFATKLTEAQAGYKERHG